MKKLTAFNIDEKEIPLLSGSSVSSISAGWNKADSCENKEELNNIEW